MRKEKIRYVLWKCNKPVLVALLRKRLRDARKHCAEPNMTLNDFVQNNRRKIQEFLRQFDYNRKLKKVLFPLDGSPTKMRHWDLELLVRFLINICGVSNTLKRYMIKTLKVQSELRRMDGKDCARNDFKDYRRHLRKMRFKCYKRLRDPEFEENIENSASEVYSNNVSSRELDGFCSDWTVTEQRTDSEGSQRLSGGRKYNNIELMLKEGTCEALRALVKQLVHKEGFTLDGFLARHRRRILRRISICDNSERQARILYPAYRRPSNILKWDIYLLCFILLYVCVLHENIEYCIEDIIMVNNEHIHNHYCCLKDYEYRDQLDTLKNSIHEILSYIKDASLTSQIQSLSFDIEEKEKIRTVRRNGTSDERTREKHIRCAEVNPERKPWTSCIVKKDKNEANRLVQQKVLPSNEELHMALDAFGRSSATFLAMCNMINGVIEKKSQSIYDTWTSYHSGRQEIVFVAVSNEKLNLKVADYHIHIQCKSECSEESTIVMSQACVKIITEEEQKVYGDLRKCVAKYADMLMKDHGKLSVILPSLKKSVGYNTQNQRILNKPCITLCVPVKGLIPIKKCPFPETIGGFPVDVIEGVFVPYPGRAIDFHEHLKMGIGIQGNARDRSDNVLAGTLGGFVDHPLHGLCGISAAHVLLSKDDLLNRGNNRNYSDGTVFQQPGPDAKPFGVIVSDACRAGDEHSPGMDVALFKILGHHPIDGSFPEAFNYREAGFDENNPPTYNSGKILKSSEIDLRVRPELYKFGMQTGISRGAFAFQGAAVRLKDICGNDYGLEYSFKDQMVVLPIGTGPFADKGDSGSLVLTAGKQNDYVAVGLVVGGFAGSTFVTPIYDILEALGCTDGMHQFNISPNAISSPDSGFCTDENDLMDF